VLQDGDAEDPIIGAFLTWGVGKVGVVEGEIGIVMSYVLNFGIVVCGVNELAVFGQIVFEGVFDPTGSV